MQTCLPASRAAKEDAKLQNSLRIWRLRVKQNHIHSERCNEKSIYIIIPQNKPQKIATATLNDSLAKSH
jgi:hypothetical protein